jgi:hypothetical protein
MTVRSNTCTKLEHVFERFKDRANICSNGVSRPARTQAAEGFIRGSPFGTRRTAQIVGVADAVPVVSWDQELTEGRCMREPAREPERDLLLEAFQAGWQAALVMKITHPRVLAVIESCFEEWLLEATDEVEVFGLSFRRREELPHLVRSHAPERSRVDEPVDDPVPQPVDEPVPEPIAPGAHEPAWAPVAAFEETALGQTWSARPAT